MFGGGRPSIYPLILRQKVFCLRLYTASLLVRRMNGIAHKEGWYVFTSFVTPRYIDRQGNVFTGDSIARFPLLAIPGCRTLSGETVSVCAGS